MLQSHCTSRSFTRGLLAIPPALSILSSWTAHLDRQSGRPKSALLSASSVVTREIIDCSLHPALALVILAQNPHPCWNFHGQTLKTGPPHETTQPDHTVQHPAKPDRLSETKSTDHRSKINKLCQLLSCPKLLSIIHSPQGTDLPISTSQSAISSSSLAPDISSTLSGPK